MLRIATAAFASAAALLATSASAIDPREFWNNRCAECHGEAAAFARTHLHVEDGKLAGRRSNDIAAFLARHETGAAEAENVARMLLAQLAVSTAYEKKCAGCHDDAATFAKASLVMRDGILIGRENQRPVPEFLKRHGKLTADELPGVVDTLARALATVAAPTGR